MSTSTEAIVYYGYSFDTESEYNDQLSEIFNTQHFDSPIEVELSGYMETQHRYFIYAWKIRTFLSAPDMELDIPPLSELSKAFDDKLALFMKVHNIVCKTKPKLYLTGFRG